MLKSKWSLLVYGLLISLSAGARAAVWVPLGLQGKTIRAMALDPTHPEIIYAAHSTTGNEAVQGVSKSIDTGRTWIQIFENPAYAVAVDPRNPATLYVSGAGGTAKSTNGGQNWLSRQIGAPGSLAFRIVPDPSKPATLFAGITQAGAAAVFKSEDGGFGWLEVRTGITTLGRQVEALLVDPHHPATVYAAGNAALYKSADSGGNWSDITRDLPAPLFCLALDPRQAETIYCGAGRGVSKSTDGGKTWRSAGSGLAGTAVKVLAVNPLDSALLLAGTDRGIFRSDDGGATWTAWNEGLTNLEIRSLVFDPLFCSRIFAGTTDGIYAAVLPFDEIIPLAVHVSGADGSTSRTDVDLLNLGETDTIVGLTLLARDQANLHPASRPVSVPAGKALRIKDILGSYFSGANASLGIFYQDKTVLASVRNLSTSPTCGTYGAYLPAGNMSEALTGDGKSLGAMPFLTHTPDAKKGFGTSIGLVNACEFDVVVKLILHGDEGQMLGSKLQTLQPFEHRLLSNIYRDFNAPGVTHGYATAEVLTENGMVFPYAVRVDRASGDMDYIPAQTVSKPGPGPDTTAAETDHSPAVTAPSTAKPPAGGYDRLIPAAAHTTGTNATWRTDVNILNPGDVPAKVAITLLKSNQANPEPASVTVTVPVGRNAQLPDILGSTFTCGNAALGFQFLAGSAVISARYYNSTPSCTQGSPGMSIPPLGKSDLLMGDGQSYGVFHQLSHSPDVRKGFRTNIGFINAAGTPADVVIRLFGDNGELLGQKTHTLKPFEQRQFSRIHKEINAPAVNAGFAVVQVTSPGGMVYSYAMVLDNISGDPMFLPVEIISSESR